MRFVGKRGIDRTRVACNTNRMLIAIPPDAHDYVVKGKPASERSRCADHTPMSRGRVSEIAGTKVIIIRATKMAR